ncbi:hypothetical protein K431DRAFT_289908, partial [Polychaeton citri CBS 116435]
DDDDDDDDDDDGAGGLVVLRRIPVHGVLMICVYKNIARPATLSSPSCIIVVEKGGGQMKVCGCNVCTYGMCVDVRMVCVAASFGGGIPHIRGVFACVHVMLCMCFCQFEPLPSDSMFPMSAVPVAATGGRPRQRNKMRVQGRGGEGWQRCAKVCMEASEAVAMSSSRRGGTLTCMRT